MSVATAFACLLSLVCGAIGTVDPAVHVASFAPYPGYSGSLHVQGTVEIAGVISSPGRQHLTWRLTGLDTACTAGAAYSVKNGCGIHVHTGTSCEVAEQVGGHYYSSALSSDPWAWVVYEASADGLSIEFFGIKVVTGLSNGDLTGRVMVVHDASGARVGCGLIQSGFFEWPQPEVICAGFSTLQANTDISGTLLAKEWSERGQCCDACEERSDCEGYVFHLDQCYLKKDLGASSFKQGAMARVKKVSSCSAYTSCFSRRLQGLRVELCAKVPSSESHFFTGTLLAKIYASDSKRCCALCDAFPGCEGYVYKIGACHLEKDLSVPSPNSTGALLRGSMGAR